MKIRTLLVFLVIAVMAIAIASISSLVAPKMIGNKYENPNAPVYGLEKYEANIENATLKAATHIIIGRVNSVQSEDDTHDVANINIDDILMGELPEKNIRVLTDKSLLENNKAYVLFLTEYDNTLYEKTPYQVYSNFTMEIDNNQNVKVISDPVNKKYTKAFANEKDNTLEFTKDYIETEKNKNNKKNEKNSVIDRIDNQDGLIKETTNIIEIEAQSVEYRKFIGVEGKYAIVSCVLSKTYKGSLPEEPYTLMLPGSVVEGGKYLLFLKQTEDGTIFPTTRNGSVIDMGSDEYQQFVIKLNNIK